MRLTSLWKKDEIQHLVSNCSVSVGSRWCFTQIYNISISMLILQSSPAKEYYKLQLLWNFEANPSSFACRMTMQTISLIWPGDGLSYDRTVSVPKLPFSAVFNSMLRKPVPGKPVPGAYFPRKTCTGTPNCTAKPVPGKLVPGLDFAEKPVPAGTRRYRFFCTGKNTAVVVL